MSVFGFAVVTNSCWLVDTSSCFG